MPNGFILNFFYISNHHSWQSPSNIIDNYLEEMDDVASDKTYSFLNAYYFMIALINDVILAIVIRDALLALFSLAFVFFWFRINTGSWFLAGVGLFEIFFSIPSTFTIALALLFLIH